MPNLTPANAALVALIADRYDMSHDEALNFCLELSGRTLADMCEDDDPVRHRPHISRPAPGEKAFRAVCACGFRSDTFDTYQPAARAANQHHTDMGAE